MRRPEDAVWNGLAFTWKQPPSWAWALTTWLRPRLRSDGIEALRPGSERDICWDDEAWIELLETVVVGDFEVLLDELAEGLGRAILRTYHGTRMHDAGAFFRDGLRIHDRTRMTDRLRTLVEENDELAALRGGRLAKAIDQVENDIDHGRLHVVADDAFFLDHAAHYLIYGSEWIMAVLGDEGRRFLTTYGTPTLLEIDLPLSMVHPRSRYEFARMLAREWVRLTCNRTGWTAPIEFRVQPHHGHLAGVHRRSPPPEGDARSVATRAAVSPGGRFLPPLRTDGCTRRHDGNSRRHRRSHLRLRLTPERTPSVPRCCNSRGGR